MPPANNPLPGSNEALQLGHGLNKQCVCVCVCVCVSVCFFCFGVIHESHLSWWVVSSWPNCLWLWTWFFFLCIVTCRLFLNIILMLTIFSNSFLKFGHLFLNLAERELCNRRPRWLQSDVTLCDVTLCWHTLRCTLTSLQQNQPVRGCSSTFYRFHFTDILTNCKNMVLCWLPASFCLAFILVFYVFLSCLFEDVLVLSLIYASVLNPCRIYAVSLPYLPRIHAVPMPCLHHIYTVSTL